MVFSPTHKQNGKLNSTKRTLTWVFVTYNSESTYYIIKFYVNHTICDGIVMIYFHFNARSYRLCQIFKFKNAFVKSRFKIEIPLKNNEQTHHVLNFKLNYRRIHSNFKANSANLVLLHVYNVYVARGLNRKNQNSLNWRHDFEIKNGIKKYRKFFWFRNIRLTQKNTVMQ